MSDVTLGPGIRIRISVEGGGDVRTVNGVRPDASGNVEITAAPDESEIIDLMTEIGMLPTLIDGEGAILRDNSGAILLG